ncbi:MAG: LolA family protein [Bacteriovoracaceae bacterium]
MIKSLLILLTLFSIFSLMATDAKSDEKFLPDSFRAEFLQELKGSLFKKKKKKVNQGVMDYQYPGSFRFVMKGHQEFTVVSNKNKTWYYKPPFGSVKHGEVKISASNVSKQGSILKFFDMLKNGLKDNKHYKVSRKNNIYSLTFSKDSAKEFGIIGAKLDFKSKVHKFMNLSKIIIERSNKKKTELNISKMEINKVFHTNHFKFFAPPNTRKTYL